ncbi:MAG: hypothetical protein U0974_02490, partial [Gemmatimonadales bacterium]|nr:hypothetical protein [Gemmatimonadales bacterium]
GTRMEVLGLDHDTGEFVKFGDAQVSADGATVDSIGGVVVANSWHGVVIQPPDVDPDNPPAPKEKKCKCGSTVGLTEGNLNITHSVPAYRSLGQARGVTLSYNHITADPNPVVRFRQSNASLSVAGPASTAATFTLGGLTVSPTLHWQGTDQVAQSAIQVDVSGYPSGSYSSALEVTTFVAGSPGNRTITVPFRLSLINLADSPYGAGWHIEGLERIEGLGLDRVGIPGDRLIIDGASQATMFFPDGVGGYVTPAGDFTTLSATDDGYERRFPGGTVKTYDKSGRQITETDRNGNTTTYTYDGDGRLIDITDPVGLKTTFSYFASKLARITDPAGRVTRFEHDSFGNLTRIIEPDGGVRTFAYDAPKGRIVAQTNERGFITEYQYNSFGRLESAKRPDGSTVNVRATTQVGLIDPATGNGTEANPAQAV